MACSNEPSSTARGGSGCISGPRTASRLAVMNPLPGATTQDASRSSVSTRYGGPPVAGPCGTRRSSRTPWRRRVRDLARFLRLTSRSMACSPMRSGDSEFKRLSRLRSRRPLSMPEPASPSAQFRQGDAFLQHGSILLEDNQSFVLGLMRGAIIARSPQRTQDSTKTPEPRLRSRDVAEAITRAAGTRWPGEWDHVPDLDPALHSASFHFPHYRSFAWTWAR
jgi:hypothetical protein